MKSILLLICCAAFLISFASARIRLNGDGQLLGVSQKKLEAHVMKAIEGFRKMMPKGDEEMYYPIMDPYVIEDLFWNHVDRSVAKKYELYLLNKNDTILKGLSNFEVKNLQVSAKDMRLSAQFAFQHLQTEFPYKLDGYMFKKFLPIYGEGIIKLLAPYLTLDISIKLDTYQGYIEIEKVDVHRFPANIEIQATGLMDVQDKFATVVLDDILNTIIQRYGDAILSNYVENLVEETIGGMTTNELFEYLDYFAKKSDEQ